MSSVPNSLELPLYISITSSPITWSWVVQLGDNRKNSVTSFLAHAAETVLRLERLGITFNIKDFNIDQTSFLNPFDEPRLKSVKKSFHSVNIPQNYYPLLFAFLKETPKENRGKKLLPLVEVYLISFWGQAVGEIRQSEKNLLPSAYQHIDQKPHAFSDQEGTNSDLSPNRHVSSSQPEILDSGEQSREQESGAGEKALSEKEERLNTFFGEDSDNTLDEWS